MASRNRLRWSGLIRAFTHMAIMAVSSCRDDRATISRDAMTGPTTDELTAQAAALARRLIERKETIAVSESSTGGLISAALLGVPGASAYFLGGGVVYTQAARRGLLRIPDESVKGIRSSTEAYALLKARTIRELLGATWGLAETGASGPTGNRYGDAAGHACFAVTGPVERAVTLETAHGDREKNMWAFAKRALELLEAALASR